LRWYKANLFILNHLILHEKLLPVLMSLHLNNIVNCHKGWMHYLQILLIKIKINIVLEFAVIFCAISAFQNIHHFIYSILFSNIFIFIYVNNAYILQFALHISHIWYLMNAFTLYKLLTGKIVRGGVLHVYKLVINIFYFMFVFILIWLINIWIILNIIILAACLLIIFFG
jgi:hypothetical protein